ncbi:hypothetical protein KY309_03115 [Candidatus Woesearchaeota archaeon]|nr:hypothetical protein [Candidatus Woesearchaeota archaeon]MBW3016577.1 hypothetical protein [Candidatus Woesearchaeota archaeon]
MSLRNYLDKVKRYFKFSKEEWIAFFLAALGLALIYSWTEWGTDTFDLNQGLKSYAISLIFILITLFVHHAGQRLMALYIGLRAEQKLWWYGILIGLMLTILSNGKIKFLAATGTIAYMLPAHRIGAFRYGPGVGTLARIALAGPVANIFFSAIIKTLEWTGIVHPYIGQKLFVLNLTFAFWNLIPIPPLDGSKLFYYSRLWYIFLFGSFAGYVFLVYAFAIYSYIFALLIGAAAWFMYLVIFERKWWS